jgi:cupin fold WbuC family metalloprotein
VDPTRIQLLDDGLIAEVSARAENSPRRRINHNFHSADADNPHKFLNVLLHGTYVTPHRHRDPPKSEMFVLLEGQAAVFLFDDRGRVSGCHRLGRPGPATGIDIPAGVWHTIVPLTPRAVCLEIKPGPWDPGTDKEFAPWAPREGAPDCAAYLGVLTASCK